MAFYSCHESLYTEWQWHPFLQLVRELLCSSRSITFLQHKFLLFSSRLHFSVYMFDRSYSVQAKQNTGSHPNFLGHLVQHPTELLHRMNMVLHSFKGVSRFEEWAPEDHAPTTNLIVFHVARWFPSGHVRRYMVQHDQTEQEKIPVVSMRACFRQATVQLRSCQFKVNGNKVLHNTSVGPCSCCPLVYVLVLPVVCEWYYLEQGLIEKNDTSGGRKNQMTSIVFYSRCLAHH